MTASDRVINKSLDVIIEKEIVISNLRCCGNCKEYPCGYMGYSNPPIAFVCDNWKNDCLTSKDRKEQV